MSKYVLVLGVITTERNMFGGIVDIEKDRTDVGELALVDAIKRALQDRQQNPQLLCGSSDGGMEICSQNSAYEPTPFTGTIEEEVLIYVD